MASNMIRHIPAHRGQQGRPTPSPWTGQVGHGRVETVEETTSWRGRDPRWMIPEDLLVSLTVCSLVTVVGVTRANSRLTAELMTSVR